MSCTDVRVHCGAYATLLKPFMHAPETTVDTGKPHPHSSTGHGGCAP
jgi:hypothetical protein